MDKEINLSELLGEKEGEYFEVEDLFDPHYCRKKYVFSIEANRLYYVLKDDRKILVQNINSLLFGKKTSVKKPILTSEECDYLKAVIYPVRDKIEKITKIDNGDETSYIHFYGEKHISFDTYDFDRLDDFIGMESNYDYTIEELGL